jgi:hypothetical protein
VNNMNTLLMMSSQNSKHSISCMLNITINLHISHNLPKCNSHISLLQSLSTYINLMNNMNTLLMMNSKNSKHSVNYMLDIAINLCILNTRIMYKVGKFWQFDLINNYLISYKLNIRQVKCMLCIKEENMLHKKVNSCLRNSMGLWSTEVHSIHCINNITSHYCS